MAETTKIADYTWEPWKEVDGTRVVSPESSWSEVVRWNAAAERAGVRQRVMVPCDVFEDWGGSVLDSHERPLFQGRGEFEWTHREDDVPAIAMSDVRARLFRLIDATPNLDWLLLTKRPENIARMMPPYFPGGYIAEAGVMNQEGPRPNVWLGVSCENQEASDERIPHLLGVPAAVRFLSLEPLLGPIKFDWCEHPDKFCDGIIDPLTGVVSGDGSYQTWVDKDHRVSWVIVGGESGRNARPCDVEWIRSIVRQCEEARVACFVKQFGSNVVARNDTVSDWFDACPHLGMETTERFQGADGRIRGLRDPKGGDLSEFPKDLQVRQMPGEG